MTGLHPLVKPLAILGFVITMVVIAADSKMVTTKITRGSMGGCSSASSVIGCGGPSLGSSNIRFRSAN